MRASFRAMLSRAILVMAAALSGATLSACATVPAAASPTNVQTQEQAVRARVQTLLDRYAANDAAGVIALLDPVKFTILGTEASERVDTPEGLRALMAADFKLWGTARFTEVRDFDCRLSESLATAWFTISFSASGGQPIPVRLTTTWRKVNGEWMLSQSANAVPGNH